MEIEIFKDIFSLDEIIFYKLEKLHHYYIIDFIASLNTKLFLMQLVAPMGNTTFEICFLAQNLGQIKTTLYIHSSRGSFKYHVGCMPYCSFDFC